MVAGDTMTNVNLKVKLLRTSSEYLPMLEERELVIIDNSGLGQASSDGSLKVYGPANIDVKQLYKSMNFTVKFPTEQPQNPQEGTTYVDKTDYTLKCYNGTNWEVIGQLGTQLPYWIESTSNTFNIWTKVSIGANESKILYVKQEPGHSPSGDEVFEFFDDFNGNSLDTSKWTVGNTGSYELNNGNIKVSGGYSPVIIANWDIPSSFIISAKVWVDNSSTYNSICYSIGTYDSNGTYLTRFMPFYSNGCWYYNGGLTGLGSGSYSYTSNTPVIFTISVNEPNMKYIINDQELFSISSFDLTQVATKQLYLSSFSSSCGYIDYIYIRKYTDQEPLITTEQIDQNTWKITVINPNNTDLTDFQVKIPGNNIVSSSTGSLLVLG